MDRKEYWNTSYLQYWKKVIAEAETSSQRSRIKKLSGNDFKAPSVKTTTDIFDLIEYKPTDKLLDYGCGTGRFFPYFSEKCEYYGIDISEAMIKECVNTYSDKPECFTVAEGERLPFPDSFFDIVICIGVFDACYQELALAEMFRVLKTGGFLLFSGKNNDYYDDDDEALIAEVNARKKMHPNYFTDVKKMMGDISGYAEPVEARFALKRGDYSKGQFLYEIPEKFYEYIIIVKKTSIEKDIMFNKFSDEKSKTWERRGRPV